MQQEIGLGLADRIETIVVRWPGDPESQVFHTVELDTIYDVLQGAAELIPIDLPRISLDPSPKSSSHLHSQP